MIFFSTNETDRPKWEWLLSLPIGATFVTRRAIKRECKCICGKVLKAEAALRRDIGGLRPIKEEKNQQAHVGDYSACHHEGRI